MSEKVTLYHPELETTIEVFEDAVEVHEQSGWTRDVPSSEKSSTALSTATPAPRQSGSGSDEGGN